VGTEEIEFRSDVTVELVRHSASDADVLFAARVSTQGEQTLTAASSGQAAGERDRGLINYLMRDRHGSPPTTKKADVTVNCAPSSMFPAPSAS
jgi:thymidylate synthase (FAD)